MMNPMKPVSRAVVALAVIVAISAALAAPAEPGTDAKAVALTYVAQLKAGKVRDGVLKCWNVDALLNGSCGLAYAELTAEEKTKAQQALAAFIAAPFDDARLKALFAAVEVAVPETKALDDGTTVVRLDLTSDGGRFKASTRMLLRKYGDSWCIVDQSMARGVPISSSLGSLYTAESRGGVDSVEVVLARAAEQIRSKQGTR